MPIVHVSDEKYEAYDSYDDIDELSVPMPTGDEEQSLIVHRAGESSSLNLQPLLDRSMGLAGKNVSLKGYMAERDVFIAA